MKTKTKKRLVLLEVTMTKKYLFEEGEINGWPVEKVVEDWFVRTPLSATHATRDANEVGNSTKFVEVSSVRVVDKT